MVRWNCGAGKHASRALRRCGDYRGDQKGDRATPSQLRGRSPETGSGSPGMATPEAWTLMHLRNPVVANGVEVEGGLLPRPDPSVGGLRGWSAFDKKPRAPHHAAPRCENDAGGRFTNRPSGDSPRPSCLSAGAATPWRHRRRVRGGAPATGAVAGATRLAEGSVRRRAECVFTPSPPRLDGSLPHQRSLREGGPAPRRGGGASVRRPPVCRSGGRHRHHAIRRRSLRGPTVTGRPLRP